MDIEKALNFVYGKDVKISDISDELLGERINIEGEIIIDQVYKTFFDKFFGNVHYLGIIAEKEDNKIKVGLNFYGKNNEWAAILLQYSKENKKPIKLQGILEKENGKFILYAQGMKLGKNVNYDERIVGCFENLPIELKERLLKDYFFNKDGFEMLRKHKHTMIFYNDIKDVKNYLND